MGRRKKTMPKRKRMIECHLGGIPMKIKNGKVSYAKQVAYYNVQVEDNPIHLNAVFPSMPVDNFVRRHIYNIRFNIIDEDEDERRKREYKEWWEKQQKEEEKV